MRRHLATLSVATALVVAACGSGGGGGGASIVTTAATAPPTTGSSGTTATTQKGKATIGQVIDIVPVGGTVGGVAAFAGQGVAARDLITSDANGKIRFNLGDALPFCQVETSSEARARPGGAALVDVTKGTVLCRTSSQGQLKTFNAGGSVLQAVDPVFLLSWDGSEVGLRVAQGFVGVRTAGGTVPVGASQQTSYAPSQRPGVGPWDQSDVKGELRDTLQQQIGQAQRTARAPGYPQVGTGGSPALATAVQRGQLRVAVTSDDDRVTGATTALLRQFLAHAPQVGLSVQAAGGADATALLNRGDVDLVVSSDVRGRASRALFSLDGDTWFVTQGTNGGNLLDNLAGFLSAALRARCSQNTSAPVANPGQSCYETTYRQGIGAGSNEYVPLDGLAPYLGLG